MSSSPQALRLLLDQAEQARDDAQSRLETARRNHDSARQQMQSLGDFRQQYQDRWKSQFHRSGGVEILRCYQDFMARLSEAEGDQERRCQHLHSLLAALQGELMACEQKLMAITRLQERRDQALSLQRQRQDQKATDEMAARARPSAMWSRAEVESAQE